MNKLSIAHILSGIVIMVFQILLLRNIQVPVLDRFVVGVFLYPLIVILLPISLPRSLVLTAAFVIGLMVDIAYDSLGLHTSALVLMAFSRSLVLKILEPRGGYADNRPSVNNYSLPWFMGYSAFLLVIHILVYFSFDAFSFVFLGSILINTILSFGISYILVTLYSLVFRS